MPKPKPFAGLGWTQDEEVLEALRAQLPGIVPNTPMVVESPDGGIGQYYRDFGKRKIADPLTRLIPFLTGKNYPGYPPAPAAPVSPQPSPVGAATGIRKPMTDEELVEFILNPANFPEVPVEPEKRKDWLERLKRLIFMPPQQPPYPYPHGPIPMIKTGEE